MKILVVSGGCPSEKYPLNGIFEFDQAKALKEFGHEVLFVSIDLRSIRRKRKLGKSWLRKNDIDIVNYSIPIGRLPISVLYYFGKVAARQLVNEIISKFGKPDLIHAHFFGMGNIAIELKERLNVPLFFTEHSSFLINDTLPKSILKSGKKLFSKTDSNIVVSQALADKLKSFWNASSTVIHNIVDVSLFKLDENIKRPNQDFIFVAVGQLIYRKGFDVLIEAFYEAKMGKNVKLFIIGGGEMYNELNFQINNYGLTDQITLLGYRDRTKIAEILKQSDAFVLASRGETFGVVYIEAMAAGLPIIATSCGGPEDFVNEENGILVNVDDIEGLSKAMKYVYNNIEAFDRELISNSSYNKFSSYSIANKLTLHYNNILGK